MAERVTRCRALLGTFVEVTADSGQAIEHAFDTVARVDRLMSAHEPGSDVASINRFSHLHPVEVDQWTALVLERALFWARESGGAFDAVRAGKASLERGLLPIHDDQPRPEASHWTWLEIQGRSVQWMKPGCVDLGGIAKGFAADRAIEALRTAGAECGLVNAGGDLRGFGSQSWPVTIVDPLSRRPLAAVELCDGALATSALLDGQSVHLPGRDGRFVSASVRAPSAMDADALTKVVLSGSLHSAQCLAIVGAEGFRILHDGSVEAVEMEAADA